MAINPLTREQKLLAELVVQLGNIAEAIGLASAGDHENELLDEIEQLQTQLETLTTQRAQLTAALAASNEQVSLLQQALDRVTNVDLTPDSLEEVMSHLNIEYEPEPDPDPAGSQGTTTPNSY